MGTQRQIDMTFDISYPSDQAKFLQRLGEKNPTDIVVQVFNKGVPYNLSGVTLGFEMRNDKEKILIDKDQSRFTLVLPLEGVFSYRPPLQVQSFYGNSYLAYFTFESGADRITTERFRFYNDEDVQLAVAPELQEHYVSVIDDLVASNKSAMDEAKAIRDLINANGVVKKVGDTMTGNLNFSNGNSIQWFNGATRLFQLYGADNSLALTDVVGSQSIFNYSPSSKTFNVNTPNTNLVKKTGDTMTGNLSFASASQIQNLGSTGQLVFGNSGIWINDTNGNFVPWQYRYSDKQFIVNAETNLMKKTDYSGKDETTTLTLTGSASSIDGITPRVVRRGNTVTVTLAAKRITANNDVVVTLPANCRPPIALYKSIISTDGVASILSIGTNGQIFFGDGQSGVSVQNKNFYVTETFVVN